MKMCGVDFSLHRVVPYFFVFFHFACSMHPCTVPKTGFASFNYWWKTLKEDVFPLLLSLKHLQN